MNTGNRSVILTTIYHNPIRTSLSKYICDCIFKEVYWIYICLVEKVLTDCLPCMIYLVFFHAGGLKDQNTAFRVVSLLNLCQQLTKKFAIVLRFDFAVCQSKLFVVYLPSFVKNIMKGSIFSWKIKIISKLPVLAMHEKFIFFQGVVLIVF